MDTSTYNSKYYKANRDLILAHRRQKYAEDPSYSAAAKARSKRRYWVQERPKRIKPVKLPSIQSLKPILEWDHRVDNPDDSRHGQLIRLKGYSSRSVAALLGRTPQTLRLWERSGIIPEPAFRVRDLGPGLLKGRNPRLYTEDELAVLSGARELMYLPAKNPKEAPFAVQVREGFSRLVQGVEPHYVKVQVFKKRA